MNGIIYKFFPLRYFLLRNLICQNEKEKFFENRKTREGKLYSTLKFSEKTSMLMIFQHSKAKTN